MNALKRVLPTLKPYWKEILLSTITMILIVIANLLIPQQISRVIDEGIAMGDLNRVITLSLSIIGLALLSMAMVYVNNIYSVRATEYFAADVRDIAFRKIQTFSFANLEKLQTSELLVRLTSDINILKSAMLMTMRMVLRAPLMMIGSLIMLIFTSPELALILVVMIPLTIFLIVYFSMKSEKMYKAVQNALDRVNTIMQENIAGVQVVKAFVRSDYENKRFGESSKDYMELSIQVNQLVALLTPTMMMIMGLGMVAITWLGGDMVIAGNLTTGELVAFTNYLWTTMIPVVMMGMVLPQLFASEASVERIYEIIDTEETVPESENAHPITSVQGCVAFENVNFHYKNGDNGHREEEVLTDISFVAEPGETLAILGATGSGKTSLVNLIPRFYDVTAGRVTIDGQDVRDLTKDSLRDAISVCLQESVLFSGSIEDNIRYGNDQASDELVQSTAKIANAAEFISEKEAGYHTQLGQRGAGLSGGQKQRLAIARAIAREPQILILDDSTSAVDAATEAEIQAGMNELAPEMTKIIIAQRISTVLNADKIVVLDGGRVSGIGNHEELLASNAIYQDIYASQLGNGQAKLNGNKEVQHA